MRPSVPDSPVARDINDVGLNPGKRTNHRRPDVFIFVRAIKTPTSHQHDDRKPTPPHDSDLLTGRQRRNPITRRKQGYLNARDWQTSPRAQADRSEAQDPTTKKAMVGWRPQSKPRLETAMSLLALSQTGEKFFIITTLFPVGLFDTTALFQPSRSLHLSSDIRHSGPAGVDDTRCVSQPTNPVNRDRDPITVHERKLAGRNQRRPRHECSPAINGSCPAQIFEQLLTCAAQQ